MAVTKEQVQAKATELGVELSDDQVSAYITIGQLPVAGSPPGDDDDDDDDDDDESNRPSRAQKRIKKLAAERKAARAETAAALAKVKAYEDAEAESDKKKAIEKGEHEKVAAAAEEKAAKAEARLNATKEQMKTSAIKGALTVQMLSAGIPAVRLPKALKLFDFGQVEFSWTDEEKMEYEIDDLTDAVAEFVKDNDFFVVVTSENDEPSPFSGNPPPRVPGGKSKAKDKEAEAEIRSLFSAL